MDLRTPVSRMRHVGAFWLVCVLLFAGGCNRPADRVPDVQGKKPVAAEPAPPKAGRRKDSGSHRQAQNNIRDNSR